MKRWILNFSAIVLIAIVPEFAISSPVQARVVSIAGICLFIWIFELVPPFIPALVLWAAIPVFLFPIDSRYTFSKVLSWAADPVIALFFGGFVLGIASERQGFDALLARFAFRKSGSSFSVFLLLVIVITAFLSMWLSNIAAAALVLACVRPALATLGEENALRRIVLVAIALGADLGGIATPIGTGPNAIAIASLKDGPAITFVNWMMFAVPLTIGMLALGFILLWLKSREHRNEWNVGIDGLTSPQEPHRKGEFLIIFCATVVMWLTEPFHNIPAAVIAVASAALIFARGVLAKKDLSRVDWSTLLLIAGGITLGRLLEAAGVVTEAASWLPFSELPLPATLFVLCLSSALLSALMSNTATAVMLIPLAATIVPGPSTAVLIAISASFGLPFVISTPPNAMAYGEGGMHASDFFWPGVVVMIVGCATVSLTGRAVLGFVGIQ